MQLKRVIYAEARWNRQDASETRVKIPRTSWDDKREGVVNSRWKVALLKGDPMDELLEIIDWNFPNKALQGISVKEITENVVKFR